MADLITSRSNPLVKQLQTIRDDRATPLMFLEGPRLLDEVIKTQLTIEILIWTPAVEQEPVLETARQRAKRLFKVSETVFKAVSDVDAPQGVLAIARCPHWSWADLWKRLPGPVLVLDGLQDPGNLAAILRTGEAAGAAGVVSTPTTARIFAPKALRGAAGSSLRLPCREHAGAADIASELKQAGCKMFAAAMASPGRASIPYTEVDWKKPCAVLLGQEGRGLSEAWGNTIDHFLHIPMQPPVDSLNVAAAAAVLLYESARQRAI